MLNRFVQNRLRKAYDEPLTRPFLARRFSVSESTIARFWREQQADGNLPARPRKHFAESTSRPLRGEAPSPAVYFDAVDEASQDIELDRQIAELERQAESFQDRGARNTCELLAALAAAHPERDNWPAQSAPDVWLTRDRDASLAPSREQLRNMARKFDQGAYIA